MSASHIAANRNSTPEGSSSLRPPNPSRNTIGGNHHLRASADMGGFSAQLAGRGVRPASEVYFGRNNTMSGNPDEMERAAQQWLADIDQYEVTLEEMATATLDQDFKDELSAIEQWFRVLSEAERTAALYALLQQTTQVQIRFFIQVLQQMSKSLPMSSVLSPANFGEKGKHLPKLSDAMSKLSTGENRHSLGLGRPPPSPGAKRNSGLDTTMINRMFPDAAAAIAKQKADFTDLTGIAPASNRNSLVDRNSLAAPTLAAPEEARKEAPSSPWGEGQSGARPKSSGQHQPMGQFSQPPPSAGLRSPRLPLSSDGGNVQSTTLSAPDQNAGNVPMLSPSYAPGGGSWASQLSTPMVSNFSGGQSASQAEMVANATAMKLAALSTVNNRIQLDDVRKYRRARSSEGQGAGIAPPSPGLPMGQVPNANFVMTNELGQVLSPQQAAALQAQQLAAMHGRRSRPTSPGLAMQGQGMGGMNFASPQNNGFLAADYGSGPLVSNNLASLSLSQFGIGMGGDHGYISDHSEINRGRSPRGRRGSSKPPEDPTDPSLLQDIPSWLRSLRLHKYTDNLKDLKWHELIELDDDALDKRGVNALGARRKMLKVFEQVKEARADGKIR
ncbi:hypothetical protein EJ04DRAFT_429157 [Polyplosphaeria fusca]|uniref:RNA-binding protein VTS1 n=1 Tax=Polyplosphaeria fusca TaxID=682080 RepID=A0A9P4R7M7_9PLEO|nr:hypothetical protein EJ04DRAFT_429157 [Polyplosphaeria fusca]